MPWRLPPDERERSEEAEDRDVERARVRDALLAGAEEGDPDWLLAHLLDYHQREERPQWWEYFFHRELDDEELVRNRNTLGGLVPDGEPYKVKQSWWYPFSFEAQEHKIHETGVDPALSALRRRGRQRARDAPAPSAPPAGGGASARRAHPAEAAACKGAAGALLRFAENRERYPAAVEILERRSPRARLDGTRRGGAQPRRELPLRAGPAGLGEDVDGARAALALMRRAGASA